MPLPSRALLTVVLALLLSSSRAAAAGDENEEMKKTIARNYVMEGDAALEKGDVARAIERFERAERLVPAPTVRLRIARLYVQTGKLVEAREKYELAAKTELKKESPDIFFRAVVEAQKELAEIEPKVPTLEIVAPKGEMGAKLDGSPIPQDALGKPIQVNPGRHVVTMPCCATQETDVKEGARLKLVMEAPPKVATQTNLGLIAGLGAIGVGLGAAGVAVVAGSLKANSLNTDPKFTSIRDRFTEDIDLCASSNLLAPGERAQFETEFCQAADSAELVQLVFYPLAVVGVGVGAFLLATSGTSLKKPVSSRLEVLPTFGRGQSGVLVRGSF